MQLNSDFDLDHDIDNKLLITIIEIESGIMKGGVSGGKRAVCKLQVV